MTRLVLLHWGRPPRARVLSKLLRHLQRRLRPASEAGSGVRRLWGRLRNVVKAGVFGSEVGVDFVVVEDEVEGVR